MKEILPQDLLKFGLIPEFTGRIPVIVTLQNLDEEALARVLKEPKNALIKQYQKLFSLDHVELEFTDEAVCEIAKEAIHHRCKRFTGDSGGTDAECDV